MKFAVVVFPGSNCDHDAHYAAEHVLGQQAELIWHKDTSLKGADAVILPGGFAHGDYLRTGAIARFSPIMQEVKRFADAGGPVLGICNGFQIGIRAGLFGRDVTLTYNASGTFCHVWDQPHLVAEDNESPWLNGLRGSEMRFPCAHGEGRLVVRGRAGWRVALRYPAGRNPDGSSDDIAGITSEDGLVMGLMNHPERNVRDPLNLALFKNGVEWVRG